MPDSDWLRVVDVARDPIARKFREPNKLPPRQVDSAIAVGYLHYRKADPNRVTPMERMMAQKSLRCSKRVTSASFNPVAACAITKVRMSAAQAKLSPGW